MPYKKRREDTTPPPWSNTISLDEGAQLSSIDKLLAIDRLTRTTLQSLHINSVAYYTAKYVYHLATGTKAKLVPSNFMRFFQLVKKEPGLRDIIYAHTEFDRSKWLNEVMLDASVLGIENKDSFTERLHVWTLRNGLNEYCDEEGVVTTSPVVRSPICNYYECMRLRKA